MSIVLCVKNVSKHYKENKALLDVSFSVSRGQIVALLGKNGAGKTTLIKCIMGTIQSYTGCISIFGQDSRTLNNMQAQKCGFLVEPAFIPYLSGSENLSILASIYGVRQSLVEELLGVVSLKSAASRKVSDYSYGMKQRLGLAQALLTNPELLILDEPTVGLDPVGRQMIFDKLLEIQKHGTTILLSTHELDVAQSLSSRALLIADGIITRDVEIDKKRYLQIIVGDIAPIIVEDMIKRFNVRFIDNSIITQIEVCFVYNILAELYEMNIPIIDISEDESAGLEHFFYGGEQ